MPLEAMNDAHLVSRACAEHNLIAIRVQSGCNQLMSRACAEHLDQRLDTTRRHDLLLALRAAREVGERRGGAHLWGREEVAPW